MQKHLREEFLYALKDTFDAYNEYGARSNKKLISIHSWFARKIIANLGGSYFCRSLGLNGEYKIEGKYYTKAEDITIFNKFEPNSSKPIVALSFKFVTSNYAQNSNNYFENLLGETANIRRVNVGFAHFLVLRGHTPYYDKAAGGERGNLKKTEILSEEHIEKYIKLFKDADYPHKPDVLGMAIVDFDRKNVPYFVNLQELGLSSDAIMIVEDCFSVETFIEKVSALCKLKT